MLTTGAPSARSRLPLPDWALELTEPATIAAADQIGAAVGAAGLAGLVNNAGVVINGPLEFLAIDALRRQIEVNVIGHIAVTQALLPLVRKGHGRIVMMGSISSHMIYPFTGPYAASKAALQSLTAALRVELRPWHIPVTLVVPGTIATPLWGKAIERLDEIAGTFPPEALRSYGPSMAAVREFGARTSKSGSPPDVVAAAVAHALTATRPRTRYVVGRHARLVELLSQLPRRTFDEIFARLIRLPRRVS
jgi:NAD(P)-dependent dehydrogenase (short-subunit alcohol dehydrogenase family)